MSVRERGAREKKRRGDEPAAAKTSIDGGGLVEAGLLVPTWLVAEMREECVDASDRFRRIDLVKLVFVRAVFYLDGEKAIAGEVFEGNGRRGVEHTDAQHEVIERVDECGECEERSDDTAGDLLASHAGSIAEALRVPVYIPIDFTLIV